MAKNISDYCTKEGTKNFSESDFEKLKKILDILPHGVSNKEMEVMSVLRERGECSLTTLSAVIGMSRTAIQRDTEMYLMKKGFLEICPKKGKRKLTKSGKDALENILEKIVE